VLNVRRLADAIAEERLHDKLEGPQRHLWGGYMGPPFETGSHLSKVLVGAKTLSNLHGERR
jgi:hypothetical protein